MRVYMLTCRRRTDESFDVAVHARTHGINYCVDDRQLKEVIHHSLVLFLLFPCYLFVVIVVIVILLFVLLYSNGC